MDIRVIIYEDNSVLRDTLSFLIESSNGFFLAGAFGDCSRAADQVIEHCPDVVLMDINMPIVDGLAGLESIKKIRPDVDVLMLTIFDDDRRILLAIEGGASGYLLKKTSSEKILEYICEVHNGGAPMSPGVARKVLQKIRKPSPGKNIYALTERESEVISLLAEGNSYKLVAGRLKVSLETVRTHVKHIYEKMHVHSVTEALAKWRTRSWLK